MQSLSSLLPSGALQHPKQRLSVLLLFLLESSTLQRGDTFHACYRNKYIYDEGEEDPVK